MKIWHIPVVLVCSASTCAPLAQAPKPHFPKDVFHAKTVAVINDTRTPGVEKGAADALAGWGQFRVVDDPQLADVTLRFDKLRHHDGESTQKPDADGKTSYGYSMSFSATITMQAFFKDADAPFYSTKTEDSKAKAGTTCVNNFHTAFRDAYAQEQTAP